MEKTFLRRLALVGAYLPAGELAASEWHPEAGFAGYEGPMRSFVEANQEIGRYRCGVAISFALRCSLTSMGTLIYGFNVSVDG